MAYLNLSRLLPLAPAVLALALGLWSYGCSVSTDGLTPQVDDLGGDDTPGQPDAFVPDPMGKKSLGTACMAANDCGSGFCAQGVCCDSPCSAGCVSCALDGMAGRCTNLAAGMQPRVANACPIEAPTTCGFDGSCDGQGGCRQHLEGTACGISSCADAKETPASTCNGKGQCTASEVKACAPYICGPRACATDCRRNEECSDNTVCINRKCQIADAPLVRFTVGTPQIDGVTDDTVWNSVPWIGITKVVEGSVGSPADLTARFKLLWTRTELFVAVDVMDSSLTNDSADVLHDDAVAVALDPNNSRGATPDGADDVNYVFGWNDNGAFREANLNRVQAVTFAFRDGSGGYGFEARIPWQTLGVSNPAEGLRMGLQVAIFDDDDRNNRDAVVVWNGSTFAATSNPALFGQVILGPN